MRLQVILTDSPVFKVLTMKKWKLSHLFFGFFLHLKRLFGEIDTSSVSYISTKGLLGYTLGTLCLSPPGQPAYKYIVR